jgi:hypothetical protein
MRRTGTAVCVVLCLFWTLPLLAAVVDVTGKWDVTVSSLRGERTRSADFVQDGESLKVKTVGRDGQAVESMGTVKGENIEWSVNRQTPRGAMTITYKGKVEGDKMKGTVQFGSRGSGDWSAKRAE